MNITNTQLRIRINADKLIVSSIFLFVFLYFIPITITLPEVVRKPLLIVALLLFIFALLQVNKKYLCMYLLACLFALMFFYCSWNGRLSFGSYMFPAFVSLEFFICALMILDGVVSISRRIVWIILVACLITAITSIIGLQRFPLAVRTLGQGTSDENAPMQMMYRQYNIAGWGLMFEFGFLVGPLLYLWKEKRRWFLVVMLVAYLLCVLMSQLAFAILLSAAIFFFVLINGNGSKFALRLLPFILLFLVAWIGRETILSYLYDLAYKSGLTMLQLRVRNLQDLLLYRDTTGDAGVRFELYQRSLSSFAEHPLGLFFVNKNYIKNLLGFHSDFFDVIGATGLLGIASIVALFNTLVRSVKQQGNKYQRRFMTVMVGAFAVMFLINPILFQPHIWLSLLVVPAILVRPT